VRTRLTHSLEVSSVARGLARAVSRWLLEADKIKLGMDRQIEAIAATCGLIHDLGNPPFGHSGEDAIRDWFGKRFGEKGLRELIGDHEQLVRDFLLFEGNAQTLRLVAKLQILADYHGLNLTFGTLSANCKYIAASHQADSQSSDHGKAKPGYFASENQLIGQIREKTGTGEARNPIAFLVEAADDIVYSVADIEDGIKKCILPRSRLEEILKEEKGDVANLVEEVIEGKDRILKAGGNQAVSKLPDDVHGTAFRTAAIAALVRGAIAAFKDNYDQIMAGQFQGELITVGKSAGFIDVLKKIGRERIYCTPSNLKLEVMGRKVIQDLLDLFWEGVEALPVEGVAKTKKFSGKLGALLSENYRRVFQHFVTAEKGLPERYHRFQLLTDYICGMTDSFAKRLHAELNNG
jgi:dGTPase